MRLQPLPYRSLQVGLSGEAVDRYVDDWTVWVKDITPRVREIAALPDDEAAAALPVETVYPLPPAIAAALT